MLVSVGTAGTSALRGIHDEAQRSRRAVDELLLAEDSAGSSVHSAEAHRTDAPIAVHFQELVDTDPSGGMRVKVAALRDAWRSYVEVREGVISLAQQGKLAEARALERGPSSAALAQAEANVQAIEQSLADLFEQQQETVNIGLREALAELGALAAATILICHHADLEPP